MSNERALRVAKERNESINTAALKKITKGSKTRQVQSRAVRQAPSSAHALSGLVNRDTCADLAAKVSPNVDTRYKWSWRVNPRQHLRRVKVR